MWLSSQEIKEKYVSEGTYTITKKAVDDKTTRIVKAGTPLIVSRSGILARLFPISIPTKDVAINQDIKALIFDKNTIDTNFFVAQLQKNTDFILKTIVKTGTTVQSINMPDLYKLQLSFPSKNEQDKVGTFFKQIDNNIALHQDAIQRQQDLKKALLQKLFPVNGERIPTVRFATFKEEWEQRKLGELLTERNEQLPESFEYPLMSFVQGKGVTPKSERYDRSFLVKDTNKKYKKTELDDFIYSSNNLETGSIGFNKTGSAVISPVYSIFYSKIELESQFIGILSTRRDFINKMIRFRQGVVYGQWKIHEKDFLSIEILIPSAVEQENIIIFVKQLDDIIALHQDAIHKLQLLKQSLLQKMFV